MTLVAETPRRNGGAHVVGVMCNRVSHYATSPRYDEGAAREQTSTNGAEMTGRNYAITQNVTEGKLVLHTLDCPMVSKLRAFGAPILTLFECDCGPDDLEVDQHCCLIHQEPARRT